MRFVKIPTILRCQQCHI